MIPKDYRRLQDQALTGIDLAFHYRQNEVSDCTVTLISDTLKVVLSDVVACRAGLKKPPADVDGLNSWFLDYLGLVITNMVVTTGVLESLQIMFWSGSSLTFIGTLSQNQTPVLSERKGWWKYLK